MAGNTLVSSQVLRPRPGSGPLGLCSLGQRVEDVVGKTDFVARIERPTGSFPFRHRESCHLLMGLSDATHFDSDMDRQNVQITYVPDPNNASGRGATNDFRVSNTLATIDLIIRHRGERFTPYVMAGPGIMFSSIDTNGFFTNPNSPKQDDNDISFGYKAGGGISYKVSDSMHIFTEYRYINGSPEYELERTMDVVTGTLAPADVEIDVESHMVVGGVSIRF